MKLISINSSNCLIFMVSLLVMISVRNDYSAGYLSLPWHAIDINKDAMKWFTEAVDEV